MTTRRSALAVSVALGATLLAAGCGRYEVPIAGGHAGEGHSEQAQAEPSASASPTPMTSETTEDHELVVTFRDVAPLAVYEVVDGACVVLPFLEGETAEVVVGDADDPDGDRLARADVPAEATLLPDGSCETSLDVTVPYAETYQLGVGVPGRGIVDPSDPVNDPVDVADSPQQVTVLR